MSELRWNPLCGEWVVIAKHRLDRSFLPSTNFCLLCQTLSSRVLTEISEGACNVVVFESRFPSLSPNASQPALSGNEFYAVRPSFGQCEVIVYTPNHNSTLAQESVEQIYQLVHVWAHRYRKLSQLEFVKYVFIFENKGASTGATTSRHPHGEVHAYPFIPPKIERQLEQAREHFSRAKRNLFDDIIAEEQRDGRRIVVENNSFVAYIPFFARYPYETHVTAKHNAPDLNSLTQTEQADLAEILKQLLVAFDKLFEVSFPYIMALQQAPSDGGDYEFFRFHIEFYPPLGTANDFKHPVGNEFGAEPFINDALPEEKAAELRQRIEPIVWKSR